MITDRYIELLDLIRAHLPSRSSCFPQLYVSLSWELDTNTASRTTWLYCYSRVTWNRLCSAMRSINQSMSSIASWHPQLILASCLINEQPLLAHHPAADDNSLIGCTRPWPNRWLVTLASAHFVDSLCPFRCSFECVLLLNQMFWKQCTVRQYNSDLSDQSALEIRVRI